MINPDYTFRKPSIEELKNTFIRDFYANAPNAENKNSVGIVSILAYASAGLIYLLWNVFEKYYKEMFIMSSTGERIDYWAMIVGTSRKQAKKATGQVIFKGLAGSIIPKGTQIQTSEGVLFLTDEEAKIKEGETSVTVSVTAEKEGKLGDTPKGDNLTLISGVIGIDKTAENPNGLSGGDDLETDLNYKKRVAEKFKIRSMGGNKDDYIAWVREVNGVDADDKIFMMNRYGLYHGTALVVLKNADDPIIDETLATRIQKYIDEDPRKPFTDDVYVLNARRDTFPDYTQGKKNADGKRPGLVLGTHVKLEVSILKSGFSQSEVERAVKDNLKKYFREQAYPYIDFMTNMVDAKNRKWNADGKKLYARSVIENVIQNTDGVGSHETVIKNAAGKVIAGDFTVLDLGGKPLHVVVIDDADITITWLE